MSAAELQAELEAVKTQLTESQKQISEISIERDSLKTENDKFRKDLEEEKAELKKTKELNYTLARAVDVGKKKTDTAIVIKAMFS